MGFLNGFFKFRFVWPSAKNVAQIASLVSGFETDFSMFHGRYVSVDEKEVLRARWNSTYKRVKPFCISKRHFLYSRVRWFLDTYVRLDEIIEEHNREYVSTELERCSALLSDVDGKSLDEQQRNVVVSDASRNFVLAGAGSGKTLTISGKVKYLCEEKGVSPEDILLIAFTRKSAEEMTTRISGRLGLPVTATTFHKLGLDIIKTGTGVCPDVYDGLADFVRDYFETHIVQNDKAVQNLIEYFAYYLHIPADMERFDSLGAAYENEKSFDFETIQGKYARANYIEVNAGRLAQEKKTLQKEMVKSLEEVSIANFLFLHGVRYEYERLYPYQTENHTRKPYRPDFYLPDYDIYIEHFGVNKEGRLPWLSRVEEQKYLDGMQWKRDLHKTNQTFLVETYSFYSSEGRLLEVLEQKLLACGVEFRPPDFTAIFDSIYVKESDKYFSEFTQLCCAFIELFKSNGYKTVDLDKLTGQNPQHRLPFFVRRTQLFKEIIGPLLIRYEEHLQKINAVDFSDMINCATEIVVNGDVALPYKWVIIDEFQDISVARYKLVDAILKNTGSKLLCVGDDWQSIYRFAGSDISLFTQFERYFGSANVMAIEQTYRNSQQLIDVAGKFVMRNPKQLVKNLRSSKSLDYPITFLCYRNNPFSLLRYIIGKIIREFGAEASIMLLGRTQYDFEMINESGLFDVKSRDNIRFKESPGTSISFLTVHKAKGLEADNVVLLNFQNFTLGFPNKIADDPLLELVLTQEDGFLYAEERRLLYVALTRTKNRVFVLVDENNPSEFFREFESSKSVFILSTGSAEPEHIVKCPRCKTGELTVRKNEAVNQYFVGCSNFPQCEYTLDNTSVLTHTRYCPWCGGFIVVRHGPYGRFFGCTNYPMCEYTENSE